MKKTLNIIGWLAIIASIAMLGIGSTNGHMTELKDLFWLPLIPGVILTIVAFFIKK